MKKSPNQPASGKAGIAFRLKIGHHCPACLSRVVRREDMRSKLKLFLTAVVLCVFAGCQGEDPVIAVAKSDFIKRHPKIEIVESGIRKRDADGVVVYVRFVSTPATDFPPRAGIWEDEMFYMTKDGKWKCISVKGGNYIRPAR